MIVRRIRTLLGRPPRPSSDKALFDPAYYRAAHPEAGRGRRDPFAFFMRTGWKRGHNPHPLFDTRWYLSVNDDVRNAGVNPLHHFLQFGWKEGRDPHPLFSVPWYLATNDDVRRSGVNPVLHYIDVGAAEGRDPHPTFSARDYAEQMAGSESAQRNPLAHFVTSGAWAAEPLPRQRAIAPARSAVAHVAHVIRLAAAEEALDPLDPPAADAAPLLSFVVPVFNTPRRYLDDLLASFRRQPPGWAELVFSDDGSTAPETVRWLARHRAMPSVRVVTNGANAGIAAATNAGLAQAAGAWIALLDHDDALLRFAVSRIVRVLQRHPECRFLYTDEVIADAKLRPTGCFHKPAWDPVLLSGVNYVNHLSVYRRDRLLSVGGLRDGFQGSQDYDLVLRYTAGLIPAEVLHLPYPAYLWRRDGRSFSVRAASQSIAGARRALSAHYDRPERPAAVGPALSSDLHKVTFDPARRLWPHISVVIPSRDSLPLMRRLLEGLTEGTDYPALDITVVDNGSTDPAVLALYARYRRGAVPFEALVRREPFNFSRSVNRGIAATAGEMVLLLNNDMEIIDPGWLKEMASCFAYPGTGIVGARLLYPDRTIQHVGVIAGLNGLAGHWFVGQADDTPGPMGRLRVRQSLSAVTAACMLVSRTCLAAVGPFDEATFPVAYNDVDFCLRAVDNGWRVVFTPFATLIHHESASRGSDRAGSNAARFARDKLALRDRHSTGEREDAAFNPWLSRTRADFAPVLLDRLPAER